MDYNNYFMQPQRTMPQNMVSAGLKGRPVSSIDEARAIQIDFDGSLFIFPDIANKKIYTKQIGMDGSAVLNMYELKPIPSFTTGDFVTREEFDNVVAMMKEALGKKEVPQATPPQEQPKQNFNF